MPRWLPRSSQIPKTFGATFLTPLTHDHQVDTIFALVVVQTRQQVGWRAQIVVDNLSDLRDTKVLWKPQHTCFSNVPSTMWLSCPCCLVTRPRRHHHQAWPCEWSSVIHQTTPLSFQPQATKHQQNQTIPSSHVSQKPKNPSHQHHPTHNPTNQQSYYI